MTKRHSWINPATFFTIARVPLLIWACFVYADGRYGWAVAIMAFAAFTDFLDGWVARKFNCITEFGRKLDPLTDKVFMVIAMAFAIAVIDGQFQRMAIFLVVMTEAVMISITLVQVARKRPVPTVVKAGKWGMFMRMVAVISLFLAPAMTGVSNTVFVTLGFTTAIAGAVLGMIAARSYIREARAIAPNQHS